MEGMLSFVHIFLLLTLVVSVPGATDRDCYLITPQWAWISGSNRPNSFSVTEGNPDSIWPGARAACLTAATSTGLLVVYGGWAIYPAGLGRIFSKSTNELWIYDVMSEKWEFIQVNSTDIPQARHSGHACAFGDEFFIFGGLDQQNRALGDTWTYSLTSQSWHRLNILGPKGRTDGATWCAGSVMYVYGGHDNVGIFTDFWKFDLKLKRWEEVPQSGAYDVIGGRISAMTWVDQDNTRNTDLYLFGGATNLAETTVEGVTNDMYIYHVTENKWDTISNATNVNGLPLGYYGNIQEYGLTGYPGGRYGAATWRGSCGNLWLMFGSGYGDSGKQSIHSDIWTFHVNRKGWALVGGYKESGLEPLAGPRGSKSDRFFPGALRSTATFPNGDSMFLFGGLDKDGLIYNALWKMSFVNESRYDVLPNPTTTLPPSNGLSGTAIALIIIGVIMCLILGVLFVKFIFPRIRRRQSVSALI